MFTIDGKSYVCDNVKVWKPPHANGEITSADYSCDRDGSAEYHVWVGGRGELHVDYISCEVVDEFSIASVLASDVYAPGTWHSYQTQTGPVNTNEQDNIS